MTLAQILDLLHEVSASVPVPVGPVTAGLMCARTAVRHASLIWLTRGATPQERALILTALNTSPRPSLRSRVRRLLRRP